MTVSELRRLPDEDLNEQLAVGMGWRFQVGRSGYWIPPSEPNCTAHAPVIGIPNFCSPDSPRRLLEEVEMEINRRALGQAYLRHLPSLPWPSATATARERTIAAIIALKGGSDANKG